MENSDQEYIDGLSGPEKKLPAKIYERCFEKMKGMVLKNSGSEEDAWDVFHDALTAIYERVQQKYLKLTCPIDTFVYAVCYNMWMSELRKRKKSVTFLGKYLYIQRGLDEGMTTIIDEIVAGNKDKQRIMSQGREACEQAMRELFQEKLIELGGDCRELIQMFINGRKANEIAEERRTTANYIRRRKSECKQQLMVLMQASPKYEIVKNCMYE